MVVRIAMGVEVGFRSDFVVLDGMLVVEDKRS